MRKAFATLAMMGVASAAQFGIQSIENDDEHSSDSLVPDYGSAPVSIKDLEAAEIKSREGCNRHTRVELKF